MAKKVKAQAKGDKRPKQRLRGVRTDNEAQLWANVRRACEEEFKSAFGREWREGLIVAGNVTPGLIEKARREAADGDARKVLKSLRYALKKAYHFFHRSDEERARSGFDRRDRIAEDIKPLMDVDWIQPLPDPPDARARLICDLDMYDFLRIRRRFTVREIAVISLLLGNRPGTTGIASNPLTYTAPKVIKAEENLIRSLVKRNGKHPRPENRKGHPAPHESEAERLARRVTLTFETDWPTGWPEPDE